MISLKYGTLINHGLRPSPRMGSTTWWALKPTLSLGLAVQMVDIVFVLLVQRPGLTCYSSSPVTVAENSVVFEPISGLWRNLNLSAPSQRKTPQCKFFPYTSLSRSAAYPPPLPWILIWSEPKIN